MSSAIRKNLATVVVLAAALFFVVAIQHWTIVDRRKGFDDATGLSKIMPSKQAKELKLKTDLFKTKAELEDAMIMMELRTMELSEELEELRTTRTDTHKSAQTDAFLHDRVQELEDAYERAKQQIITQRAQPQSGRTMLRTRKPQTKSTVAALEKHESEEHLKETIEQAAATLVHKSSLSEEAAFLGLDMSTDSEETEDEDEEDSPLKIESVVEEDIASVEEEDDEEEEQEPGPETVLDDHEEEAAIEETILEEQVPAVPTSTIKGTCSSLVAREFEESTGGNYSATYYRGGYIDTDANGYPTKQWGWPKIFTAALQKNGWRRIRKPKDCATATFKVMRDAGALDGAVYNKYCSKEAAEALNDTKKIWRPSVTLGLKGDRVLGNKETFQNRVRNFELRKNRSSNVSNSFVPLTFMLHDKEECETFFSADWVPQRSWVAKKNGGYGGAGVDVVNDFDEFRKLYGDCNNRRAPMAQELIKPPLANGKTWNYRVFLMIANLNPITAFRRVGDLKICVEDYDKRNDKDEAVRAGATKCNLHVAQQHPQWHSGKPDQITMHDIMKPLARMDDFLDTDTVNFVMNRTDEALKTLTNAMVPLIAGRNNNNMKQEPDLHVGFYAIDAIFDELSREVKLIDFNTAPGPTVLTQTNISTDEIHGMPFPEDFSRMALTAFQQFQLKDDRFNLDACVDKFSFWNKLQFA